MSAAADSPLLSRKRRFLFGRWRLPLFLVFGAGIWHADVQYNNDLVLPEVVRLKLGNHWRFLRYLLEHKRLVFLEACKLGIPWRGLLHDLSKFLPREWGPRVAAMDNRSRDYQDERGFYLAVKVPDELAASWLHHYHHNRHHWQWWVVMLDSQVYKVLPMPDEYRREMLADWLAVARMPGRQAMLPWYRENADRMLLHPETRFWLESQLGLKTNPKTS